MKIFAFDVLSDDPSICLFDDQNPQRKITKIFEEFAKPAEKFNLFIDDFLKAQNLNYSQIDAFATISGPGSFTSIRINLAILKAWQSCFKNAKFLTFNALEAIANFYKEENLTIVIDAKLDEFFIGEFTFDGQKIQEIAAPKTINLQNLKDQNFAKSTKFYSNCPNLIEEIVDFTPNFVENDKFIAADSLVDLTKAKIEDGFLQGKNEANYLREAKITQRKK